MRTGRPKAMLTMSNDERTHLFGDNVIALAAGGCPY